MSGDSRRAWGWHPLADHWAARLVTESGVRPGELVLDIGAGTGTITRYLVESGARVLAVELHPGRIAQLRQRFRDAPVTVVPADARALRLPYRPFRVVASPPFGIAAALLRRLTAPGSRLVAADLVLPRAVVRRWAERPSQWEVRAGRPLPRSAFQPPPRIDSGVLLIRRPGRAKT